jgi:uncharacterized protein (DUF4415 family)
MAKGGPILRRTQAEVAEMIDSGEISMDFSRAREISDEELEAIVAADPDDEGAHLDWSQVTTGIPLLSKAPVTMRLDQDILEFFRKDGPGYQTRINAVLRFYVDEMTKRNAGRKDR